MKNVKDQVYKALLMVSKNVSDTYPKDWANFPTIQYVEENNSVWERTDNAEQMAKVSYKIDICTTRTHQKVPLQWTKRWLLLDW